jgi:IMP dehydrogenase
LETSKFRIGLTFDDVLLVPRRTGLNSRAEADTRTKFTRNISLNIPLVSANMATVTEHKMAIAMAREGGIGIIHQFNTVEQQCNEIRKVKRSTSYVIENPRSVSPDTSIGEAIEIMKRENVTSLLVIEHGELAGIFTSRDYLFEYDANKRVREVMTPRSRLITAPFGITLDEAKHILHQNRIEKLPLLDDHGKLKGLMTTKDIMKIEHWPNAARDDRGRLRVGAAIGVKDTLERARAVVESGADVLVLDIAHGHADIVIERLKEVKAALPHVDVMVGNIATAEAAEDLIAAGADGLKVGIGPSRVCSTRIVSGSGVPQLTAVMDVVSVASRYGIPVCSDGGTNGVLGNVSKALAAGASSVMSGSFYAGSDEAPGMIFYKDGRRFKRYIGSASYDSSHERKELEKGEQIKERLDVFVEGVSNLVEYKGPVEEVIKSIVKGIKSGISYCGARNIEEMQKNSEFIQVTTSGIEESKTRGEKLWE